MKQDASYDILNGIRQERPPKPVFTLPNGYFESFTNRLMKAVQDTDAFSPTLDTVSKEMPYDIPWDYFSRFRVDRSNRIIPFKKGLTIAASFILLAVTSIFLFTQKLQTTAASQAAMTATVNQLTNEQLERFIQLDETVSRDQPAPGVQAARTPKADITPLLKNVPDAELASFLKETAEGNEEILLN